MTHSQNSIRVRIATVAVAAAITVASLALVLAAAPQAQAAGLINCVEQTRRAACYELVWVNGVQVRMTFAQAGNQVPGTPNTKVNNFYVIAPQTDTPQAPPPSFPHDHVVGVSPPQNHGNFSVFYHGYFVICSAEGIASGGCVPTITSTPFGTLPLAKTVNGQMLTSVDLIESAVNSGLLVLVDTGAVLLGTINPGK
jgi:hypothetical protein